MFSDEAHTEAGAVHIGGAPWVRDPRRRLRHGAQGLILRAISSHPGAVRRTMNYAATAKPIALTNAAVLNNKWIDNALVRRVI